MVSVCILSSAVAVIPYAPLFWGQIQSAKQSLRSASHQGLVVRMAGLEAAARLIHGVLDVVLTAGAGNIRSPAKRLGQ